MSKCAELTKSDVCCLMIVRCWWIIVTLLQILDFSSSPHPSLPLLIYNDLRVTTGLQTSQMPDILPSSQHFHLLGNPVNCCKLTCQLLAHNLQAILSSSRFEHQPNPTLSDRQFPEVMFSPYKFLFSMVLIQFHFLEEFKCLKTKVVWYENPGLPASRRARTPSDARGACSIVCRIPGRAPNISQSFHNSTQNSFILNWVCKDAPEPSCLDGLKVMTECSKV